MRLKSIIFLGILIVLLACGWFFDIHNLFTLLLRNIAMMGIGGAFAFVLLYILLTLAMLPAALIALAAGALYGLVWGSALALIGINVGASIAFLLGRYFLRSWVQRKVAGYEKIQAIYTAISEKGGKIVFLLRLSPAIPYCVSHYAYGLTDIRFRSYFIASAFGMFPWTVACVYLGSLLGNIAQVVTFERSGTPAEYLLFTLGFLITIATTVYIVRLSHIALSKTLSDV